MSLARVQSAQESIRTAVALDEPLHSPVDRRRPRAPHHREQCCREETHPPSTLRTAAVGTAVRPNATMEALVAQLDAQLDQCVQLVMPPAPSDASTAAGAASAPAPAPAAPTTAAVREAVDAFIKTTETIGRQLSAARSELEQNEAARLRQVRGPRADWTAGPAASLTPGSPPSFGRRFPAPDAGAPARGGRHGVGRAGRGRGVARPVAHGTGPAHGGEHPAHGCWRGARCAEHGRRDAHGRGHGLGASAFARLLDCTIGLVLAACSSTGCTKHSSLLSSVTAWTMYNTAARGLHERAAGASRDVTVPSACPKKALRAMFTKRPVSVTPGIMVIWRSSPAGSASRARGRVAPPARVPYSVSTRATHARQLPGRTAAPWMLPKTTSRTKLPLSVTTGPILVSAVPMRSVGWPPSARRRFMTGT